MMALGRHKWGRRIRIMKDSEEVAMLVTKVEEVAENSLMENINLSLPSDMALI
jgi:Fe-S cluster assembly scaffold protein SufB